jgi:hypothetical protein
VDEKMEQIKALKDQEISALMNNPKVTGTSSIAELMKLFGDVKHDERGRLYIVSGADVNSTANRHTGDPRVQALDEDGFLANEQ